MVSLEICLGLGLALTLLTGFVSFDQLVRVQYTVHYQDWLMDHKPDGFLWRPPGHSIWNRFFWDRMNWSGYWCFHTWMFRTPQWSKLDKVAGRHLWLMRTCVLVWNVGFLLMFLWSLKHPELFRWLNKPAV